MLQSARDPNPLSVFRKISKRSNHLLLCHGFDPLEDQTFMSSIGIERREQRFGLQELMYKSNESLRTEITISLFKKKQGCTVVTGRCKVL